MNNETVLWILLELPSFNSYTNSSRGFVDSCIKRKRNSNIIDVASGLQTCLERKATCLTSGRPLIYPALSFGKRKIERYCAITFLRLKHNNTVSVTFRVAWCIIWLSQRTWSLSFGWRNHGNQHCVKCTIIKFSLNCAS